MSIETLRQIVNKLNAQIKESRLGKPFFGQSQYNPHSLKPENFSPIKHVESGRRFAFFRMVGHMERISY
ncbi:unnamed protein product [marine sediment metagenome]|uniref:Uncharacterized protein n=1 Tax=marine sediment metagenome TaxID=412755 RepID=X1DA56_9ZZZZ